jgi:catechol 2,3-dioxygenase-like lactoylglutathione lyase family enzyme
MSIDNALASVAVKDLDISAAWYARLLGTEGKRPMAEVAEWTFPRGGGLQVYKGADRAGNCSFTLAVSDLEEQVRTLVAMDVDVSKQAATERVKTVMVRDPDGNSIAIAQALDASLAR